MNNTIGGNMLLINSSWGEGKTFKLLPLTQDCPYVECIFDPATHVLVVISKVTKTALHMLPKLDDNGDSVGVKVRRPNNKMIKEERKSIETFQEYYIEDKEAIVNLIQLFGVNNLDFDYNSYLTAEIK